MSDFSRFVKPEYDGYFIRHNGAGNMCAEGKLTAGFSGTWFARDAGSHL